MISPDIRIHILIESIWRNIAITLIELVSLILTQNSGKTVGRSCEEYCSERILPRKLSDCGCAQYCDYFKVSPSAPKS